MQTAMQPLAAGLITPKQHGLSFTSSSGRWVAPPTTPRRRRGGSSSSTHRRTASRVSCSSSIRIVEANGDTVVTIDPPELASRKVLLHKEEGTREQTVTMKATVKVHLKDKKATASIYETYLHKKWLFLELVSSELDDPETKHERTPVSSFVNGEYHRMEGDEFIYEATFNVPASFGTVGAVHVENRHDLDMFIKDITVSRDDGGDAVCFPCNSWVVWKNYNPKDKRIFFPDKSYLPSSQTLKGLERLRKSELQAIRGDGTGQRKKTDRIYDYDVYNDLGNPDDDDQLQRPVLGGSKHPYPRRCRTGREPSGKDPSSEKAVPPKGDIYVPRDETFSEHKQHAFDTKAGLSFVHQPITKWWSEWHRDDSFPNLEAINNLYKEGFTNLPDPKEGAASWLGRAWNIAKNQLLHGFKFPTPEIHQNNNPMWRTDEEFARETLAGMNPLNIQLVTKLPIVSELDEKEYAPKESLITEDLIYKQIYGAMTAAQAVEKKRLFMLDYHDLLLPYVHKVRDLNKNPKEEYRYKTTLYGSRTLFFLTDAGTLKPIAIELTRPNNNKSGQQYWRDVFTPGAGGATESWLWRLAKTHVLAHDTGYHQLVNHWLRTHCCVEPYIIAANRQLSQMHPIYRLLHPHFRYTMEINAFARKNLINAGGIIESTFSPNKYCMEISSVVYDKFWRFDMEALPNDLIRRGMAVQGEDGELKLTIEDYPYANDGLLVWKAIKDWVSEYVGHYYQTAADIVDDEELQAWWTEVRTRGHEDKKDEPWWPKLDSHESLVQVLATIIWVTSAHHAAVNFGQYPFGGYIPNRPTIARINMPTEKGEVNNDFQKKPDKVLMDTLPSKYQSIKVMATLDLLSYHSPEEEYMGTHIEPAWKAEGAIYDAFQTFKTRMVGIREQIEKRNKDPELHNRCGAGLVPYTLLMPCDGDPFDDEPAQMEMGIPNSISI